MFSIYYKSVNYSNMHFPKVLYIHASPIIKHTKAYFRVTTLVLSHFVNRFATKYECTNGIVITKGQKAHQGRTTSSFPCRIELVESVIFTHVIIDRGGLGHP